MEFIRHCPPGFDYCLEIRNPNYLTSKYFKFLESAGLRHVFLQGYYMPSIFDLFEKPGSAVKELTVIRLHGPDRKGIEKKSKKKWDRIIEPRDADLDRLIPMLGKLASRHTDIYLNVNNHYEGCAPLTISRIRERLEDAVHPYHR